REAALEDRSSVSQSSLIDVLMKNLRRAVNPRPKRYPPDLESLQHTPENALIACIADLCGHRRYRPRDNK
ncbi:Amiloride-sensitive sodium channel subunit beta, partial [Dissostichus eleginoides]